MNRSESVLNRSQVLVLGFLAAVTVALAAILLVAPGVYGDALNIGGPGSWLFLAAVVVLIAFLGIAVVRRWRWTFWLIVIAFVTGILRVPASIIELAGIVPVATPAWYLVLQAAIGALQFTIGLALLRGYRKGGVWGAF